MPNNNDFDELCDDQPSDRFDHHMERLEGRDLFVLGAHLARADVERVRRERQAAEETVPYHYDTRRAVWLVDAMKAERARADRMEAVVEAIRGARHNLFRLGALSASEIERALTTLDGGDTE